MIGDNLLIYDESTGDFFGGWDEYRKIYAGMDVPIWLPSPRGARCTTKLRHLQRIRDKLGGGARIISETQARRIMAMRKWRMENVRREGKSAILQPDWEMPVLQRQKPADARV